MVLKVIKLNEIKGEMVDRKQDLSYVARTLSFKSSKEKVSNKSLRVTGR